MAALTKEEYLKRYMSNENGKDKKKRKKVSAAIKKTNVRIIDDDIDLQSLNASTAIAVAEPDDEAPTVAEFIDERPEHVRRLEEYRSTGRWKTLGKDEQMQDIASKDYGLISVGGSNMFSHTEKQHGLDFQQMKSSKTSKSKYQSSEINRPSSDSDYSPPSKRRHDTDSDSDSSPPRCATYSMQTLIGTGGVHGNHSSDSDVPVGRKRHDSDSESSPLRKRHDSDSDQSPLGKSSSQTQPKSRKIGGRGDFSPPRRKVKESDSDQSPPRRRNKGSDSDQSLPRRRDKESDSDQSPPRRRERERDLDQSPSRRRNREIDSDQSPPRRRKNLSSSDQPPSAKGGAIRPSKTLSGAKAGLSTAQEMKIETKKLREEEERSFQKMSKDALGKDAKTIFRDKMGKKRDFAAEKEMEEEEAKRQLVIDRKYKEWGQGLKQKELREQAMQNYAHEMAKPMARYKDDVDLDRMMRELDREGDPMAAFLKKKKTKQDESGKERPQYKGPAAPPNRFGIMPGYRWDGVDRSNGFEKQLFSKIADKKSIQEQAYKWSTEDM